MQFSRLISRIVLLLAMGAPVVQLAGCAGGSATTSGGSSSVSTGGTPTTPATTPGVVVSGSTVQITTSTLQAVFTQATLTSLVNRATGESYVATVGSNWVDLPLLQSNGQTLTPGAWVQAADGNSASIQFKDTERTLTFTVGIAQDEVSVQLGGSTTGKGVVGTTWGIQGLNLNPGRLLVPGQAGTYVDAKSAPSVLGIDYPVEWEHQMVIYQGAKGSVLLYARDQTPAYKRLLTSKPDGTLNVSLETFAPGPWANSTQAATVEWRLHGFADSWMSAAQMYKAAMTAARPFTAATGNRAWVKNVRGVVIFETLDPTLLTQLAQRVVPSRTVLLMLNWRLQPFDQDYPDYTPDPNAKAFIDQAHALGFRVMLHTSLLGVSEANPAYAALKSCQIKTPDALQLTGWLWDALPAGDVRRFAYMSPACSAVRKTFINSIAPAISALQPDAIHLDAGGAIINDGNGLIENMNSMQGMIQMHKDLLAAFPDLVLGGESTNEIIGPYNWLAQRWNAVSPPSPLSNYLLGDQVFPYGFLGQPAPDDADFTTYLSRYEGQGVVPVAFIVTPHDLDASHPRALQVLQLQQAMQTSLYSPDWQGDWTGLLFREKSADGTRALTIKDDGTFVTANDGGSLLYQRAHGSSAFTTANFVTNWPAYDNATLFGTDPLQQYWLTSGPYRPSGELHLASLPANLQIGTDTLRTNDYGVFEIDGPSQNWFDFIAEFGGATKGTTYNLTDYGVINGAVESVGTAYMQNVFYSSVIFEHPPYLQALGGSDFIEYQVPVPSAPKVSLTFNAGLSDGSEKSDGAIFGLQVNGQTAWKQTILPGSGWNQGTVDLTPYAGTTVKLRLMVHPGLKLDPNYDSACWYNLQIVTDFSSTAKLSVALPAGVSQLSASSNASVTSVDAGTASVSVAVPGKFAVFTSPPAVLPLGSSLLSVPLASWTATGGLPQPGAYDVTGTIDAYSSGGVTQTGIAVVPPRDGQSLVTAAVKIPATASRLNIGFGLGDAPAGTGAIITYSGAQFSARINGTQVFSQYAASAGWAKQSIDLSPWRGQPVVIELIVDATGDQLFDFGRFSDLTIQ